MSETVPHPAAAEAPAVAGQQEAHPGLGGRLASPARALGRGLKGLCRRPLRLLAIGALLALIGVGACLGGSQLWAWYHFRAGRACLERHHVDEAAAHFDACLRVWPRDRDALLLAARAAWRSQAFESARDYLDRYQQVAGQNEDLLRERALLTAARGDVDTVGPLCRSLVDQGNPAAFLALEALTAGCLRMFRLAEATRYLDRWLELDPDHVQAHLLRAHMYDLMTLPEEAVPVYRRIVQLDPAHDDARLRLAKGLLESHRHQEARPHLEYLRERLPDNAVIAVGLSQCQEGLGDPAEAERLVDEALVKHPHHAPALAQRGKLALAGGDLERAEAWLREAVQRDPADRQARYRLRLCLERNDKSTEAQEQQRRLEQMDRDMDRLANIVRFDMGKAPHNPALHHEVGAILIRAGAYDDGLRWLHQALKADPQHVPAHEALADIYQRTGNLGLAARHRELARTGSRP